MSIQLNYIGWTINRRRRGGNQNTRLKALATSFRKCHKLKPEDSRSKRDSNLYNSIGGSSESRRANRHTTRRPLSMMLPAESQCHPSNDVVSLHLILRHSVLLMVQLLPFFQVMYLARFYDVVNYVCYSAPLLNNDASDSVSWKWFRDKIDNKYHYCR